MEQMLLSCMELKGVCSPFASKYVPIEFKSELLKILNWLQVREFEGSFKLL
jgi:hypothetical protein